MELRTSQSDFKDEWYVNKHRISFANVNSYYDNGYSVYYGETNEISQSKINEYMSNIAKRYQDIFGLYLSVNSATYYSSPIDICKGTVSATNINTLCYHNPVHTDRNNMIDWFGQLFIGNTLTTNVYWSCHKIRSIATNGSTDYNRSCSSGYSIIMIERSSSLNRDLYSQGVLMHELNHQYGARDHYHELADGKDPNSCKFKDICSYCGTNPRPSSCIMYDSRIDINSSQIAIASCNSFQNSNKFR